MPLPFSTFYMHPQARSSSLNRAALREQRRQIATTNTTATPPAKCLGTVCMRARTPTAHTQSLALLLKQFCCHGVLCQAGRAQE